MAIERKNIDGRPCYVAYLTAAWEPTTPDKAQLLKIIFDDGAIAFAPSSPVPAAGGSINTTG